MAVDNRDGFFGGTVIAGFAGKAARDGRPTKDRSLGRYFHKLMGAERSHLAFCAVRDAEAPRQPSFRARNALTSSLALSASAQRCSTRSIRPAATPSWTMATPPLTDSR